MIELTAGELVLGLVPEIGGSIACFRAGGVDLMRPLSAEAERDRDVLGVASFPMLPYANRIDGNSFAFEGETFAVKPNNPPERFNVHGSGWKSAWSVEERSEASATLGLDFSSHDDPYRYRATQRLALRDGTLTLETTIENRARRRMPFGFGHHPWFPRDPDVSLAFRARDFWLEAPNGVAGDRISVAPELDFSAGRELPKAWRNNNYGRWDGVAEIRFPSRGLGLRMEADPVFRNLMFYADPKRSFFCVEPQTNVSCAFGKTEESAEALGVIALAPGESASGTLRFTPFRL
jgi:aldose 1-epimerase